MGQPTREAQESAEQGKPTRHRAANVVFRGKTYPSVEDMPLDLRQAYKEIMALLDSGRSGVPDLWEEIPQGIALRQHRPSRRDGAGVEGEPQGGAY